MNQDEKGPHELRKIENEFDVDRSVALNMMGVRVNYTVQALTEALQQL